MVTNNGEGQLPELPRLLKPEQVAGILNVSRSFAYHLMQTGAIPTVRLGRACRVRPQDLQQFIINNTHDDMGGR